MVSRLFERLDFSNKRIFLVDAGLNGYSKSSRPNQLTLSHGAGVDKGGGGTGHCVHMCRSTEWPFAHASWYEGGRRR